LRQRFSCTGSRLTTWTRGQRKAWTSQKFRWCQTWAHLKCSRRKWLSLNKWELLVFVTMRSTTRVLTNVQSVSRLLWHTLSAGKQYTYEGNDWQTRTSKEPTVQENIA
jgi:hypothetical protein